MKKGSLAILVAAFVLALAATALANPANRTFQGTYPYAARLCAKADAGTLGKRLEASADKVKAACANLKSSFQGAQSNAVNSLTQIQASLASDRATMKQQCAQAKANHDHAACVQARATFKSQRKDLNHQRKQALQTYHLMVDNARKTFWSTIRSLRGGKGLHEDSPKTEQS